MDIDAAMLKRVADELEIRNLVARYANAVAVVDGDGWIDTWAADGSWTLGGNTATGHEALLAMWQQLIGLFEKMVQLPQHALLDVAGDRGTGSWGVVEIGRGKDDGPRSITLGSYTDVYRREVSGWKFAERAFDITYSGPPDLTGHWFA